MPSSRFFTRTIMIAAAVTVGLLPASPNARGTDGLGTDALGSDALGSEVGLIEPGTELVVRQERCSCDSVRCTCDGGCWETACCETPIERYRKSFYQGSELLGGYLVDTGDQAGGMDQTFEEARVSFGLPLGSMDNILGFRPYFRADHLRGPTAIDLPGTLYNTGVSILNQKKWSDRWSTTLVLAPSVRSDFTTSEDAFRLFGLALLNWQCRRDLSLSFGVVYFDRADFRLLPAVGASWTPTPRWKIDATMPRPRIARRIWKDGGNAEGWAYFGGMIGGNTWAVTRLSGQRDELTIRDLRLLFGYEVIRQGNRGCFVEGGLAMDRTIEYERQDIEIELDSGVFVQAGWQF